MWAFNVNVLCMQCVCMYAYKCTNAHKQIFNYLFIHTVNKHCENDFARATTKAVHILANTINTTWIPFNKFLTLNWLSPLSISFHLIFSTRYTQTILQFELYNASNIHDTYKWITKIAVLLFNIRTEYRYTMHVWVCVCTL